MWATIKFSLQLPFHPFGGFWDLKYEKKGRSSVALAILFLVFLTFIIKRQYTGFVVNLNNLSELNSLNELLFVVLPFFLWCVANWSLTTLMDGEGKFSEIVMATGYSLIPFILIYIPLTVFSLFITTEEMPFYYFFASLAMIWFVWLLFIGMMTIHQFTVTKTVGILVLTLIVIGIILFLGLLFFSLIQQMLAFVYTIYQEVTFRM